MALLYTYCCYMLLHFEKCYIVGTFYFQKCWLVVRRLYVGCQTKFASLKSNWCLIRHHQMAAKPCQTAPIQTTTPCQTAPIQRKSPKKELKDDVNEPPVEGQFKRYPTQQTWPSSGHSLASFHPSFHPPWGRSTSWTCALRATQRTASSTGWPAACCYSSLALALPW